MRRKIKGLILLILIALPLIAVSVLPTKTYSSGTPSYTITCAAKTISPGGTTTCTVKLSTAGYKIISGHFEYKVNSPLVEVSTAGVSGINGTPSNGSHDFYLSGDPEAYSGKAIATIKVKGGTSGSGVISITGGYIAIDDEDATEYATSNATVVITVKSATTASTKATTKSSTAAKTTASTNKKATTAATKATTRNATYATTSKITRGTVSTTQTTELTRATTDSYGNVITRATTTGVIYQNGTTRYIDEDGNTVTRATRATTTRVISDNGTTRYVDEDGNTVTKITRGTAAKVDSTSSTRANKTNIIKRIFHRDATTTSKLYQMKDWSITNNSGTPGSAEWYTTANALGLKLNSVSVDDYTVYNINGIFYATIPYDDEEVEISATADAGIEIYGTGTRSIAVGKNLIELRITNALSKSAIVDVVVTRADANGMYDTMLYDLGVIGYKLNKTFNGDVKEYNVTLPYDLSEIYIYAQSYSDDVIMLGNGRYLLSNDRVNNIYITVTYGDLETTQYAIHLKRDYSKLIAKIIIVVLAIALIVVVIVYEVLRRKAAKQATAEKNKAIIDTRIAATTGKKQDSIDVQENKSNKNGSIKDAVIPTSVGIEYEAPREAKIVTNESTEAILNRTISKRVITPTPVNQTNNNNNNQ